MRPKPTTLLLTQVLVMMLAPYSTLAHRTQDEGPSWIRRQLMCKVENVTCGDGPLSSKETSAEAEGKAKTTAQLVGAALGGKLRSSLVWAKLPDATKTYEVLNHRLCMAQQNCVITSDEHRRYLDWLTINFGNELFGSGSAEVEQAALQPPVVEVDDCLAKLRKAAILIRYGHSFYKLRNKISYQLKSAGFSVREEHFPGINYTVENPSLGIYYLTDDKAQEATTIARCLSEVFPDCTPPVYPDCSAVGPLCVWKHPSRAQLLGGDTSTDFVIYMVHQ